MLTFQLDKVLLLVKLQIRPLAYIAENFQGVQFSQIGHSESFCSLIFEVAQDLRHTHINTLKNLWFNFRGHTAICENNENFLLYGID